MKVKVKDLEKMGENMKTLEKLVLPVKITYAISHNQQVLEGELETFQEQRTKLVTECAERNAKGEPKMEDLGNGQAKYMIADMPRLEYELGKLLESVIDLDIRTISLDDIEEAESKEQYTDLSVQDMNNLAFMLEDPQKPGGEAENEYDDKDD